MAKIEVKKPRIVTFEFCQDETDKDYGSCLWARFHFDTENRSLMIESDCGNFSYNWPPEKESFLKACTQFKSGYLLGKLSSLSVVDGDKTFENVKELINDVVECEWDEEDLSAACHCSHKDCVVYDAIAGSIASLFAHDTDLFENYDLWEYIRTDYPANAKKIVEIYCEHIVPAIKDALALLGDDVYNSLGEEDKKK